MLHLRAVELCDFGPYRGEQRLEFVQQPGVTLVVGQNGRGKTLLLNALRYAFLGRVLGRGEREHPLESLASIEATRERGYPEFKVKLEFDFEGVPYRLTRRFGPVDGEGLQQQLLLSRGGVQLSQEDANREVGVILPPQVARFFLFDGELLSQYEKLVDDQDGGGEKLKDAIERILGVPILSNGLTDLRVIDARLTDALAKNARANQQTEAAGVQLAHLGEKRQRLIEEAEQLEVNLQEYERELESTEADLRGSERILALIREKDDLKTRRAALRLKRTDLEAELRELSTAAWQVVVGPALDDAVGGLEGEASRLREERERLQGMRTVRLQLEQALDEGECPVCGGSVEDAHAEGLLEGLGEGVDARLAAVLGSLRNLETRLDRLRKVRARPGASEFEAAVDAFEEVEVDLVEIAQELENVSESIGDQDRPDLRKLFLRAQNLEELIDRTNERRAATADELAAAEENIQRLEKKIRQRGGQLDPALEAKAKLVRGLLAVFGQGLVTYRRRLKEKVEDEASRLFALMGHEPDFDGLRINDQYGLTIIHKDATPVSWRAAGFEHVVALSLLGALQRCAPIRGPIVMDSPFGRLDPEHVRNVIETLPQMSRQVLLLVYEGEVDRDLAAEVLGPRLLAEKTLHRHSARHTEIRDREAR